jgi:hypothetical protein
MKNTLKIFALLFLLINNSCKAQMVQTTKDVYLLKTNEKQFINKPLKNLLKEIKPEIKTGAGNIEEGYQFFSFRFRTMEQGRKNEGNWEDRVSLYVYLKEPIDWKWEKRPKGKEILWTKEDAEKYGNLTVIRIKVISPPRD